jgi:multidrug resistance protein, MATE family
MSQDLLLNPSEDPEIPNISKIEGLTSKKNESWADIFIKINSSIFSISFSMIINYLTLSFYLVMLNSQDPAVQGAVSLSISIMNIMGVAIFVSMNIGLMSRLSHAYGAKNYKMMGLYIHRGLIISSIAVVLSSVVVYFSPYLFEKFGYSEELISNIRTFVSIAIMGFIFQAILELYRSYLNSIAYFKAVNYVQIFSSSMSICVGYVLIGVFKLGIKGVAYSMVIQQFLTCVVMISYCYIKNPVEGTLIKFERDSFKEIWELAKYVVVAGGQIFTEWIGNEIMVVLSGTLIAAQCDAFVLSLNFYFLTAQTIIACHITGSSFVGQLMGAGDIQSAKRYTKGAYAMLAVYLSLNEMILLFLGQKVSQIYSGDPQVEEYMMSILKIFMIIMPFDGYYFILAGISRALKLEKTSLILAVINMYVIGVPISFILVFWTNLEVYGIVIGYGSMAFASSLTFSLLYLKVDWKKQSAIILKQLDHDVGRLKQDEKIVNSKTNQNRICN